MDWNVRRLGWFFRYEISTEEKSRAGLGMSTSYTLITSTRPFLLTIPYVSPPPPPQKKNICCGKEKFATA